jgi:hypothetical protein
MEQMLASGGREWGWRLGAGGVCVCVWGGASLE